jgi:hypothetical protein
MKGTLLEEQNSLLAVVLVPFKGFF